MKLKPSLGFILLFSKTHVRLILVAAFLFGDVTTSSAFMAGKYKCAGADDACSLTSLTVKSFEECATRAYIDGKPNINCANLTVRGCGPTEGNIICKYEPPFLIHVDGTYSKSSEQGTFKIIGNLIDFSESKIRGTGVITEDSNLITFTYINPFNTVPGKEVAQQQYKLVPGSEEGTVTGTGTDTGSKTLKAEVKVDYSVVRADGTVRADGGFDPEKGDVATFTFTPNDSEKVTMKVFSRHSEELDSGELNVTAGTATGFTWNGRTKDSKNPVASGVYIVRIEGSGVQETRKIVVVK